jgi:hypothetical protein
MGNTTTAPTPQHASQSAPSRSSTARPHGGQKRTHSEDPSSDGSSSELGEAPMPKKPKGSHNRPVARNLGSSDNAILKLAIQEYKCMVPAHNPFPTSGDADSMAATVLANACVAKDYKFEDAKTWEYMMELVCAASLIQLPLTNCLVASTELRTTRQNP